MASLPAYEIKERCPVEQLVEQHKDVNPFLVRKWEKIFYVFFDRNASQQVDWGDFYMVLRKVREVYGTESVQTEYAKKTMTALWEGLCKQADSDQDKLISIEEWIRLLKVSASKNEHKWFHEYEHFMFKLFDVSCDGKIDSAEYVDGMSVYGFTKTVSEQTFRKLAVDENGTYTAVITRPMWSRYFSDFFFSADKNSLGNHLFGILEI
ncbi:hypothetical protein Q1695_012915 [Nippostrongylus brasiliensis]|nr:hypothetical protein Q1695_012915 [Nippostrongylus brasiliensis]